MADLHLIGFELLSRSMMRPLHRGGCLQPGHRTAESGITHAYPQPRGTPSTPGHQPGTNSAAYLARLAHPRRSLWQRLAYELEGPAADYLNPCTKCPTMISAIERVSLRSRMVTNSARRTKVNLEQPSWPSMGGLLVTVLN